MTGRALLSLAVIVGACSSTKPYDLVRDLDTGDPILTAELTIAAAASRDRIGLATLGRKRGKLLELTCREDPARSSLVPCIEALFAVSASEIDDPDTIALLTGLALSRVAQDRVRTVKAATLRKALSLGPDERAGVAAAGLLLAEAIETVQTATGAGPIVDSLISELSVPCPRGMGPIAEVPVSERRSLLERAGCPPLCKEARAAASGATGLERTRKALTHCAPEFYRVHTRDEAAVVADWPHGFVVLQILGSFADARRLVDQAPGRMAATLRRDLLPRFDRSMRTLELLIPPPPIWLDARGQAPLQQPETSQPDWHSIGHPLHILATATGLMVGKPLRIRWRAEPAGPRIVGLRSGWLPIEPRALEATIRRTAPPRMGAPLLIVDRDLSADRVAALFEPLEDEVLYLAATRQGEVVSEPLRVGRPECPRPGRWDTAPVRLSVEDHAVAVSYLDTVRRAETPSQLTAVIEELHRDDRDSLVKPVELRCAPRVTMARAVETMDAVAAAVRHSSVILAPSSFVCPAQAAPAP